MTSLKAGKLDHELLIQLLDKLETDDPAIIHPPEVGVDVGTMDLKRLMQKVQQRYNTKSIPYLVFKADPITFKTPNPAEYLITVNHNDIATSGALPIAMLSTFILPQQYEFNKLLEIQDNLTRLAKKEGMIIIGGHTEVSHAVNHPIFSGSMIGLVPPEYYIPRQPQVGDKIILSGWIGAEGTGILLDEGKNEFSEILSSDEIEAGKQIGQRIAISERIYKINHHHHNSIHMIHDITEGGILAAIFECLDSTNVGANLSKLQNAIHPTTRKICDYLDIDPLRLIGSGAFLIFCEPDSSDKILQQLNNEDFPTSIIGEVTSEQIQVNEEILSFKQGDSLITGIDKLSQ